MPPYRIRRGPRGCTNTLNGYYLVGRPLDIYVRQRIVELHQQNLRVSEISKRIKVSHGCVSKILQRYRQTGSIEPGRIGGSKPIVATPQVMAAMVRFRAEKPTITAKEIMERLKAERICDEDKVPSISSTNRIIREHLKKNIPLQPQVQDQEQGPRNNNAIVEHQGPELVPGQAIVQKAEPVPGPTMVHRPQSNAQGRIVVDYINRPAAQAGFYDPSQHYAPPYPGSSMRGPHSAMGGSYSRYGYYQGNAFEGSAYGNMEPQNFEGSAYGNMEPQNFPPLQVYPPRSSNQLIHGQVAANMYVDRPNVPWQDNAPQPVNGRQGSIAFFNQPSYRTLQPRGPNNLPPQHNAYLSRPGDQLN